MKIGPLDKRAAFKVRSITQDSTTGQDVSTWLTTLDTVWANVQDVMPSRDEGVLGGTMQTNTIKTRVRIRWRDDINSTMRIELTKPRARTLEIIGGPVEIGGRKMYLELMCEEVRNG